MPVRRLAFVAALAVLGAACSDQTGPLSPAQAPLLAHVQDDGGNDEGIHVLQQSPAAPPLQTYDTTFWVHKGKAFTLTVDYQPAAGERIGRPFLRLDVPKYALLADSAGSLLDKRDSVAMTLSIDSLGFSVEFGPSGLMFSADFPAQLTLCYENMDPDVNRDGVVDAGDQALQQQISFWYQSVQADPWLKLPTRYDSENPCISTPLYHFSLYAVSY